MKQKILVVVQEYPQVSETYIKNELDALAERIDHRIARARRRQLSYRSRRPHLVLESSEPAETSSTTEGIRADHHSRPLPDRSRGGRKIAHILRVPTRFGRTRSTFWAATSRRRISGGRRGILCFAVSSAFRSCGKSSSLLDVPEGESARLPSDIDVMRFRDSGPNGPRS
jgi:hypothetical protein